MIPSTALSLLPTTQVAKQRPLPSSLIPTLAVHRTQRCPQPPSGPNLPCRCRLPPRSPSQNFRAVLRNFKQRALSSTLIPTLASQPALSSSLPPISSGAEKFQVGALQSITRSYAEQKELSGQLDSKRHTQSLLGNHIRTIKDPSEKQAVLGEAKTLKAEIMSLEEKVAAIEEKLLGLALHLPNDTHPDSVYSQSSCHAAQPGM
ncbi:hypothetical protein OG21DRAFT_1490672 [Imleria badia]|nr:hypothetical protein OG21DRAFT_1490672 [Imleria badia]